MARNKFTNFEVEVCILLIAFLLLEYIIKV